MKFSNMDIPASPLTAPKITAPAGTRQTSKGYGCRDPYIVPYDGKYYFYQGAGDRGILCSVSEDLENWSDPVVVFAVPENFHGEKCLFWAPECHYYKGNFYIFTSVWSKTYQHRVISVYRANNPLGPFEDIVEGGCITPKDWDAIDGTLYIDKEGKPYMVFVHEWTSMPEGNGGMAVAQLSEDFTHFVTEPVQLFQAKEPEWATSGVTDGPYLYTTEKGSLMMIWSNFCKDGYVVAKARSTTGEITGPWVHETELLYRKNLRPEWIYDGGHAMIFKTHEGEMKLAFHGPNHKGEDGVGEHLFIMPLYEKDDTLTL